MRLSDKIRERLFLHGSRLSPTLGGLFQNSMNITDEMVEIELKQISILKIKLQEYEEAMQKACDYY